MASPRTPSAALANLHATALTARCHNTFFRQKQLKSLHDVLRSNTSTIKAAIKQDTQVSDAEACTEVALTLEIVSEHYNAIDTKKDLEQEYRITNGKDAIDNRDPWGVVYIEPLQSHTPLYSAIVALSAALSAGNCVALKLESNLRAIPSLLRKLLPQAIEADTFAILSTAPSSESLTSCLQVLQETQSERPTHSQLASPKTKVIAVVDRTADLSLAAEQLVAARFAFGGTSPYAPDLVLVNEFIKKDFLELVLRNSIQYLSGSGDVIANGSPKSPTLAAQKNTSRVAETFKTIKDSKAWKINVITQGDNGAIVELTNLSELSSKITQPLFCISSITSLEHAINLVDEDLEPGNTLLAAYHYGTPSAGKYLAQFINADASFVNHVPYSLILGPAGPSFQPINIEQRYTTQYFTRASPAYITVPSSQYVLAKVIAGKDSRKAAVDLLAKASQEIKETKRATSIAIGYFEQGIFIGLGVYGIPLLTCIGASLFFGVRTGLRRWVYV
ncbi:Aldehyde/histidinol dehydrogenase [Phaeosphaeriaceae sp. PMI808]|nr:Aldehyde/histidinol dehydrogenase [Phaeosphaeriaceae sp. PMI808]